MFDNHTGLLIPLTPLEPQSRFGDKLLEVREVCPQNGTAVLKGLTIGTYKGGLRETAGLRICQVLIFARALLFFVFSIAIIRDKIIVSGIVPSAICSVATDGSKAIRVRGSLV